MKSKRATISPNFNFLGQLLEYEKQLEKERVLNNEVCTLSAPVCSTSFNPFPAVPRPRKLTFPTKSVSRLDPFTPTPPEENSSNGDQSPTNNFKLVRIF